MKIYSTKNTDYYDNAVKNMESDDSYIYNRTHKVLSEKVDFKFSYHHYRLLNKHRIGIIGFCGKLYPFYILNEKDNITRNIIDKCMYSDVNVSLTALDILTIKKHVIYDVNKMIEIFSNTHKETTSAYLLRKLKNIKERAIDLFKILSTNTKLLDLFVTYDTPVFVYFIDGKQNNLIINPILQYYNFASVFDVYQTYQEIEMYISNILVKKDPEIQVSDEVMGNSKGFDRFSFRNSNTKDNPKKF